VHSINPELFPQPQGSSKCCRVLEDCIIHCSYVHMYVCVFGVEELSGKDMQILSAKGAHDG
jgi:hypothetical protein